MNVSEMVRVKDITVTSTCEHHLVTIDGKAAVAYILVVKSLACLRSTVLSVFAQRPQVQERMTQQILVALQTLLESDDVAVTIDATHYCVKSRGVMDATSETTTTALVVFLKQPPALSFCMVYASQTKLRFERGWQRAILFIPESWVGESQ